MKEDGQRQEIERGEMGEANKVQTKHLALHLSISTRVTRLGVVYAATYKAVNLQPQLQQRADVCRPQDCSVMRGLLSPLIHGLLRCWSILHEGVGGHAERTTSEQPIGASETCSVMELTPSADIDEIAAAREEP